jgi:hypothetical protein
MPKEVVVYYIQKDMVILTKEMLELLAKKKPKLKEKLSRFIHGIYNNYPVCCIWYFSNKPLLDLTVSKICNKFNIHLGYTPCPQCMARELYDRGVI